MTYGTQLKVTISRYYTPSGRCIQALNYGEKDAEGNATRNTVFNEFKTKNGRTVTDGGGIMPDISINSLTTNDFIKALEYEQILFNFATDFFYNNKFEALENFEFDDADYQKFITYVENQKFNYQTEEEKVLEEKLSKSDFYKSEKYTALVAQLRSTMADEKKNALNKEKEKIKTLLISELVKRYFYRKGLYDYETTHNEAIKEAIVTLNDSKKIPANIEVDYLLN